MGAASLVYCLAVALILAELRSIAAAPLRLPLRKAEASIRQARADVPQPLTQIGFGFVMDILLGAPLELENAFAIPANHLQGNPQQVMTVEVDTGACRECAPVDVYTLIKCSVF